MEDTIFTLVGLEDFFADLTMRILGIDSTVEENQGMVRISWSSDGAPAWAITDDVIFLQVNNVDDDRVDKQRDVNYVGANANNVEMTIGYTRVHKISWVLYGPNSFDRADLIRNGLFLNEFKEFMLTNNLAMVLDNDIPKSTRELFNGQWWLRTDFSSMFNEKVVRNTKVPYLSGIDVKIRKDR